MKKGILFSILAVCLTFTSCKKDEEADKNGLASGTIEGKVDGTLSSLNYFVPNREEDYQWNDTITDITTLSRYRSASNFENWSLGFYEIDWDTVTVPQTYIIDNNHNHDYEVEFTYSPDFMSFPKVSVDGEITITKVTSNELEGTFEGTMVNNTDTSIVTAGRFRVPYIRLRR